MYIYATQPNRFYPYFSRKIYESLIDKNKITGRSIHFIKKKTPTDWYAIPLVSSYDPIGDHCEYYQSFEDAAANMYSLPYKNGKHKVVFDDEFRKKYDYVTGVLDTEKIEKHSDDFIFTTIIHPVDRVYEMYYFMQYMACGVALYQVSIEDLKLYGNLLNFISIDADSTIKSVSNVISLETYIDMYIENKGIFKFKGTDIETCDNLYRFTTLVDGNADFVGFITDMKSILKTATFLNNKLKTDCSILDMYSFSKKIRELCDSNTYRRKDIEMLLEKEIYEYEIIKQKYMN